MTTRRKKVVEVSIKFILYYLQNIMDITNYYCLSEGDKLNGRALNLTMPGASQGSTLSAAREMSNLEERGEVKRKGNC